MRRLAVSGVAQAAVLFALASCDCSLTGSGPAVFGFVVLASAVGLSFGLVVSRLARSPKIVAAALLISFSATIGLGAPV
jgi:hypothetical protein